MKGDYDKKMTCFCVYMFSYINTLSCYQGPIIITFIFRLLIMELISYYSLLTECRFATYLHLITTYFVCVLHQQQQKKKKENHRESSIIHLPSSEGHMERTCSLNRLSLCRICLRFHHILHIRTVCRKDSALIQGSITRIFCLYEPFYKSIKPRFVAKIKNSLHNLQKKLERTR